jgi:DNA-binding MarR family transcriptional regulator
MNHKQRFHWRYNDEYANKMVYQSTFTFALCQCHCFDHWLCTLLNMGGNTMNDNKVCKNFSPVQNRVIKVVSAMVGFEANGISPGDIAKRASISASDFSKTIDNLTFENWAEKHPSDPSRYRLTAAFAQIANTIALELRTATQQLQQDQTNYGKII